MVLTKYEALIKDITDRGPEAMAQTLTAVLFTGIGRAYEQIGLEFKVSEAMIEMSVNEYLNYLNSEYEEKKND